MIIGKQSLYRKLVQNHTVRTLMFLFRYFTWMSKTIKKRLSVAPNISQNVSLTTLSGERMTFDKMQEGQVYFESLTNVWDKRKKLHSI